MASASSYNFQLRLHKVRLKEFKAAAVKVYLFFLRLQTLRVFTQMLFHTE